MNQPNIPSARQHEISRIGVRPTIVGRLNDVRESLEKPTQMQPQSIARLPGDGALFV